jgi:hypothetical protein
MVFELRIKRLRAIELMVRKNCRITVVSVVFLVLNPATICFEI